MEFSNGLDWHVKKTSEGWAILSGSEIVATFGHGNAARSNAELAARAGLMRSELSVIVHHLGKGNVPNLDPTRHTLHILDVL